MVLLAGPFIFNYPCECMLLARCMFGGLMKQKNMKSAPKTEVNKLKDPKGGLTKAGREYFARKEGALSAHAWGEAVPTTMAAAQKLAAKGSRLLKKYKSTKSQARA